MVVVDIGAVSGYFTSRMARAVGEKRKIIAVDVEQKMLDYNKQELEKTGMVKRGKFILAKTEGPVFSKNHVNLIFLCDGFHHLNKYYLEFVANNVNTTSFMLKP